MDRSRSAISCSVSLCSIRWMFGWPPIAASNDARSSGATLPSFILTIRWAFLSLPKAPRNASTAPSGFLRAKDDPMWKIVATTRASAPMPRRCRQSDCLGGIGSMGCGTIWTGTSTSALTAFAVKRLGTQISWTKGQPTRQLSGMRGNSHDQ